MNGTVDLDSVAKVKEQVGGVVKPDVLQPENDEPAQ
jgi:hypothetical protein